MKLYVVIERCESHDSADYAECLGVFDSMNAAKVALSQAFHSRKDAAGNDLESWSAPDDNENPEADGLDGYILTGDDDYYSWHIELAYLNATETPRCGNCSHYNSHQECRCPDSEHYEKYIPDTRGTVCSEHEYDEYKED